MFLRCDDVHVSGIRAVSPALYVNGSSNADGIDIDACQRVVVEDSVFDVNDDAVCIKSGVDWYGRKFGRYGSPPMLSFNIWPDSDRLCCSGAIPSHARAQGGARCDRVLLLA